MQKVLRVDLPVPVRYVIGSQSGNVGDFELFDQLCLQRFALGCQTGLEGRQLLLLVRDKFRPLFLGDISQGFGRIRGEAGKEAYSIRTNDRRRCNLL